MSLSVVRTAHAQPAFYLRAVDVGKTKRQTSDIDAAALRYETERVRRIGTNLQYGSGGLAYCTVSESRFNSCSLRGRLYGSEASPIETPCPKNGLCMSVRDETRQTAGSMEEAAAATSAAANPAPLPRKGE